MPSNYALSYLSGSLLLLTTLSACHGVPPARGAGSAAPACLADSTLAAEYADVIRFWIAHESDSSYDGWRQAVGLTRADSVTVRVIREEAVCRRAIAAIRHARPGAGAEAPSSVAVIGVGRAFIVTWPAARAGEWHRYDAFDASWRYLSSLAS